MSAQVRDAPRLTEPCRLVLHRPRADGENVRTVLGMTAQHPKQGLVFVRSDGGTQPYRDWLTGHTSPVGLDARLVCVCAMAGITHFYRYDRWHQTLWRITVERLLDADIRILAGRPRFYAWDAVWWRQREVSTHEQGTRTAYVHGNRVLLTTPHVRTLPDVDLSELSW